MRTVAVLSPAAARAPRQVASARPWAREPGPLEERQREGVRELLCDMLAAAVSRERPACRGEEPRR